MYMIAARVLADSTGEAALADGSLFPPLSRIRAISASIAAAVAGIAYDSGLATEARPPALRDSIERVMYVPEY
jgi:malate dehydrogenase (oxaloacetate-decarboxylating)(NADP+)